MAQFHNHWRRGRHPAIHRADEVPTPGSSQDSSSTSRDLIIPVAPTIIGDPFATSTTPSLAPSPSPVQSSATPSSAPPPSLTPSLTSSSSPPLSSTTSSTTSTTTSSSPVLVPTKPINSLTPALTVIQTLARPSTVIRSSLGTPSATTSSTPVGGTSSGIIVGGIIAAVLGAAGFLAAVVYFLRKCRGRDNNEALAEEIWNRGDGRGQSAFPADDGDSVRPFHAPPRPPSMVERRRLNNASSVPPRQPTMPDMYSNNAYGNGYDAANYSQTSFSPGQVVSPNSANPFFSPYARDVMSSPVSSNVPEYHDPPHSGSPAFLPKALTRQPSVSVNQVAVANQNSVIGGPFSPVVSSPDSADPHYVDLSRSSVTPYQAAQYAEISQKLGAPMSSVLGAVPEGQQAVPSYNGPSIQNGNMYTGSPFADPAAVQQPIDNPSYEVDDDLPLPSPNALQQTRIPSLPPTLPEIRVPERSFSPVSLQFPVPLSVRNSPSPLSAEFSDPRGPPPTEPNHKSSSLVTPASMQGEAQATVVPRQPKAEAAPTNRPDTVYTIYDEEDAYGGF